MASHLAFSSYPGVVSSTDDFYVASSGLAVLETSLEILDPAAWDKIPDFDRSPHVATFVHVMATTRLARSAAHWARIFTSEPYTGGSYAAQWMVVDYNQFVPGQRPLKENSLW